MCVCVYSFDFLMEYESFLAPQLNRAAFNQGTGLCQQNWYI